MVRGSAALEPTHLLALHAVLHMPGVAVHQALQGKLLLCMWSCGRGVFLNNFKVEVWCVEDASGLVRNVREQHVPGDVFQVLTCSDCCPCLLPNATWARSQKMAYTTHLLL